MQLILLGGVAMVSDVANWYPPKILGCIGLLLPFQFLVVLSSCHHFPVLLARSHTLWSRWGSHFPG